MVFKNNSGGLSGTKALLHAKKWDVYNSEKEELVKCGYSVEVYEKDRNKLIWKVVDDHMAEEGFYNKELGLRDFNPNFSINRERDVLRLMWNIYLIC